MNELSVPGKETSQKSNCYTAKYTYKGDTILREMCLLESALLKKPYLVAFLIFLRISFQLVAQFYTTNFTLNLYWHEWLMTTMYITIVILIYGVNFTFIFAGLTDFNRKLFFMKILQSMISIEKDQDFMFSTYFPTLSI